MSTDFEAISCSLNSLCLDHGLDCILVCVQEDCVEGNDSQPVPICPRCLATEHDRHKMRCWKKAKHEEINSKENAVKNKRREFQQFLKNSKRKSSARTSKDITDMEQCLKTGIISDCEQNSPGFDDLMKKSEELTAFFVTFQETESRFKQNSELYFEHAGKGPKKSVQDNNDTPCSSRQSEATQTADTYQPTPPNPDREERGVQIEPPQTPQEFESPAEEQPQVIRHNDES